MLIPNNLNSLCARQAAERPAAAALASQDADGNWFDISWQQMADSVDAVAAALAMSEIAPADCVATFSANRPENLVTDFACYRNRAVSVSIYATSSADQVAYIVNDASCKILFAGNYTQYKIAREVQALCPCLKRIVVIKPVTLDADDTTSVLWTDFIAMGKEAPASVKETVDLRTAAATPDDIATLVYTSGTTGEPKGAILTHSNYDYALDAHHQRLTRLTTDDVSMAFLPLSHIFEKGFTYVCLSMAVKVAVNRDPRAVQDTIKQVHPTVMCAVPRFWEKVYSAVQEKIASMSPLKRALVKSALKVGYKRNVECLRAGIKPSAWLEARYRFFDSKVFAQLRAAIGFTSPNFFPTAGAPVSSTIVEFFHSCGLFVMVGYGLSETTATVTCFPFEGYVIGSVGTPIPYINVKIGDNSEVLVKAPTVMRGYYNKPDATAEAFTDDGWFRTGDAGYIDDGGNLFLTDRIKDLFKTSNGKYIAPQALETPLATDKYIDQVTVIGDNRKFVSALIVPAFEALEEWARQQGIAFKSRTDLLDNPKVKALYEKLIETKEKGLASYEKIKRFTLLPTEFTMDSGELTNTLKVKRRVVAEKYAKVIEKMYE